MPRLSNSLPKYCKHRASGQAVVTLNGRDIYLGPHNTRASKLEYDRLIGEWLANGRQLAGIESQDITVAEQLVLFLKFAKTYYRKNGKLTGEVANLKSAVRPLRELYSAQRVADFGPLALAAVRERMTSLGWKRSGINQATRRIRGIFRWGVSKELITPSVIQSLDTVTGLRKGRCEAAEPDPVEPVADETVQATVLQLPSVVADMVRLQRLTGMRPGEVCAMRPVDISRAEEVWLYRPLSHKTEHYGRSRLIPIGPRPQQILLRYLARDPKMYYFRPCDSEQKRRAENYSRRVTPVSCGNRRGKNRKKNPKRAPGNAYEVYAYRRAIHRACDKAFPHPVLGYAMRTAFIEEQRQELREWQRQQRWSPNQLRHPAATEIRRKHGLEGAQVVLGHSQANFTHVYAERDIAKGLEIARLMG